MSTKSLDELYEMLCKELDDIVDKGELSAGSLDVVDKIVHSMKNIGKIMEQQYEMDESREGGSYRGGSYEGGSNRSYRGGSYRRGGSYEGGSYARGGRGRYARRDNMGRYADDSFAEGKEEIMEMLADLMQSAPDERYKAKIKKFTQEMEQM